jgi:hypothetical protein
VERARQFNPKYAMKSFKAQLVFAGSDEDFFEIAFRESEHTGDDGPYLDIQCSSEIADEDRWYIEALDPEEECGHGYHTVQAAELTPTNFRIRWGPGAEESVEVTFEVDATKYAELARVTKHMIPHAKVTNAREC